MPSWRGIVVRVFTQARLSLVGCPLGDAGQVQAVSEKLSLRLHVFGNASLTLFLTTSKTYLL